MSDTLEQVTGPIAEHGEGPCWSPSWGGLRWVDMTRGDILQLVDGEVTRTHVDRIAAVVRPRSVGGAIIAVERGVIAVGAAGAVERRIELWTSEAIRMNEGGCAPDGSFYCGSMAYDKTVGAATLYRISTDFEVSTAVANVTISNGIDWSADGSLAFYIDTATQRIDVFDWSPDRGLEGRRPFVEIRDGGRPDGLTIDADGCIWTAIANAGEVHRYTPDGVLDHVIEVPASKVTACTFGDDDLGTLYITTSQEKVDVEADPLAGSLFRVRPGVVGRPVRTFGA